MKPAATSVIHPSCKITLTDLHVALQMKLSVQESTLARVQGTLRDTEEEVRSLKEVVAQQEDELHAREMERRQLHNTIQELKAC